VPFFTVEAQIHVPARKYSDGIFRVKLLEPIALADEYLMEHGKFSFDTLKQVKEREKFKVFILPAK
jgi:hypothetical protein